eukprot:CAMPEP_0201592268 /NCGR_PEP_ID=MMETSP0190_2-20130828/190209_1 /ASSEMBLY_ACC=CAM_ASM_000263 /TAXON_ID=37353 /ORGANISM="Rosalina sp." /LENGTH=255 /DNA_ID=CAMNT_0048050965 /DNA_START=117 /DNA_END=884 /DNA_ORIENTATION=-
MMNNNKSQSMHNNWYQNASSAVAAPIQFQQFDGDDEMQQQQQQPIPLAFGSNVHSDQHQQMQMQQAQQFFNSHSNPNSFGVITVPNGCIPFEFNQGGLPQGVPEFAFANIPTNIAFNFSDNFAMPNQPQFGPPTFPINMQHMNPPQTFVGFNEQFPSTNDAISADIDQLQDIEKCARINNNNVDENNNDEEEQQDEVDMINNYNDIDTNDIDNHHFVQQQQQQDNDQDEVIEDDVGDLLPNNNNNNNNKTMIKMK